MALRRLFPELRQALKAFDDPFFDISPYAFPSIAHSLDAFNSGGIMNHPAIDLHEGPKSYIVEAELPGVDKNDISIQCADDRTLTLHGKYSRVKPILQEESSNGVAMGGGGAEEAAKLSIDQSNGVVPSGADNELRDKASKLMHKKNTDDGVSLWHSERMTGNFRRTFTFPTTIDPNRINATFKNGLLSIIIPKVEKKGTKINIDVKD